MNYDEAARAVGEAEEAWRPLVVARFWEQVRDIAPDAQEVTFELTYYDNGPFLAVRQIDMSDEFVDAVNDECADTLADLTRVFGPDLDELTYEPLEVAA
jgi:hypothetical protein